jgi:predicted amidohydrolase
VARSLLLEGATAFIASMRPGSDANAVEKARLALLARSLENRVPIMAVGSVFETLDNMYTMPTMVIDPNQGVVEEIEEPKDTYLLVDMVEEPSNIREIIEVSLRAKAMAPLYCKVAKESLVENLAGRYNLKTQPATEKKP